MKRSGFTGPKKHLGHVAQFLGAQGKLRSFNGNRMAIEFKDWFKGQFTGTHPYLPYFI